MTTAEAKKRQPFTKKARLRQPRVPLGNIRRNAAGGVAMDFIEEFTDLGAPEFAVSGIASIERISRGQVRATYYSRRKDGNIAVVHIIWDYQTWLDTFSAVAHTRDLMARIPPDGGQKDQRRERH
jgi:hypothetical protein